MKKPKLVPAKEHRASRPTMIEDVRLTRLYSVIEVATLAAVCSGEAPIDRIDNAIELLAAAEKYAFTGKWENFRQKKIREAGSIASNPRLVEEYVARGNAYLQRSMKARKICSEAKRSGSGNESKIIRTSLVQKACIEAGVSREEESLHGGRLFNEWIGEMSMDIARGLASEEMCRIEGSTSSDPLIIRMWSDAEFKHWEALVPKFLKDATDKYKAGIETGKKEQLIIDEATAHEVAFGFLGWLENRGKRDYEAPMQSQQEGTKGQIVSPKTKGSSRTSSKKYATKATEPVIEHKVHMPGKMPTIGC
jgi:hypothetical protein